MPHRAVGVRFSHWLGNPSSQRSRCPTEFFGMLGGNERQGLQPRNHTDLGIGPIWNKATVLRYELFLFWPWQLFSGCNRSD